MWFKKPLAIAFSLDDVSSLFRDLSQNAYSSIFEQATLKFLRRLYIQHEIPSTLFCYGEQAGFCLAEATDRFKNEFKQNAHWLKVGFHGKNESCNYAEIPSQEAMEHYYEVNKELIRICGAESLSKTLRLHLFSGSKSFCAELSKQIVPLTLLGADDERQSYYLESDDSQILFKEGYFFDAELNITFLRTDLRLERDDLRVLERERESVLQIFTHEWCFFEKHTQKNFRHALHYAKRGIL